MPTLIAALFALVASTAVAAPPPQDPELRPELCLNGQWQFQPSDDGLSYPPTGPWDPVPIRLPSPWNVNAFSKGDGGDFRCFPSYPAEWETVRAAWHRRLVRVPDQMRGKSIYLRFEAVAYWGDVYVNGQKAGSHEGAFTPFELEVTDLVTVGEDNEIVVGVKSRHLFTVNGRTPYGWGSFWGETISGIWQDVRLIARPRVHISDVFVQTSVDRREIEIQVTVTNRSAEPVTVRLNNHVFEADRPAPGSLPAKGLGRTHLTVPAGGTEAVTVREPWANARLWWPDDPHLYVLVSRLYADDDGTDALDMKRTRFGFREFRIGADGRKFELNGVTWSGRGDAWHFMGIPQLTSAYAKAWYEMARSANVNIIRLHAQVYPEFYLDVADEMGMLIVDETSLWGSAINFYYNDDFLRRARQHVTELLMRDRNHPSVALWSVANEIYARQGDGDNAPSQDWIFAGYAELAAEMKRLDPTREVSSDGDGDLNGRLSIFSLHYPGPADPGKGKICTIGEAGSMYYSTPPEVAHAVGDRAYLTSNDRMEAVAIETADLIEGYRKWAAYSSPFNLAWYGLEPLPLDVSFRYESLDGPGVKPERLGPYCTMLNAGRDPNLPAFIPNPLYHAVKDAFEPVRFFVAERSRMLWAGEPATRHVAVHNDALHDADLRLQWRLSAAGETVANGAEELSLRAGQMRECQVSLTPPEPAEQPGVATLSLRLLDGEQVCYEQEVPYALARRGWPTVAVPDAARLSAALGREITLPPLLWDPRGSTADVLDQLGIAYRKAGDPQDLLGPGAGVCVVGAGSGLAPDVARQLMDLCPALIVFEQNPAFYGADCYATRDTGTFKRAFAHPGYVPEVLTDECLQFWGQDGVVARACMGREVHGNVRPLVRCGDGDIVMLLATDAGRPRLLCEMALIEKASEEPAAALLVKHGFRLLGDAAVAPAPAAVIAPARSRLAAGLAALGVQTCRPEEATVMLCDGSVPAADPAAVSGFLARTPTAGAHPTLLLIGLKPQAAEVWSALLGAGLRVEEVGAAQLIRAGADLLLAGVDHRDLFGIEKSGVSQVMDCAVAAEGAQELLVTNHTDWQRWCWRGENVKTAAIVRSEREPFTRRAGLIRLARPSCDIIVSQPRLSPLEPKSLRLYSQLLTNLGVALRRGAPESLDLTAFNVDDDGFIRSWLVCGAFVGDSPHDTEFLAGEASITPEPGMASSGCIWRPYRSSGPVLDFTAPNLFGERSGCAAYAAALVTAPEPLTADLLLGSDDQAKVWLNGELVHDNAAVRPAVADSDRVPGLHLRTGANTLLCKVSQGSGKWGLVARLVDEAGAPLRSLRVSEVGPLVERQALSRSGWRVSAEPPGEGAAHAIDGDAATRWSSGKPQEAGMLFSVDLGLVQTVSKMTLDCAGSPGDYPRGLAIEVSVDGQSWSEVARCADATAAQRAGVIDIVVPPTALRYVKITQTDATGAAGGLWWSIHELVLWR